MGWLVDLQRWLYSGAVDALNGVHAGSVGALPLLVATAYAFGMLHALLPGHGKAVLTAYYAGDGKVTGALASTSLLIVVHVGSAIALVLAGFAIYQRTLGGAGRAVELQTASQVLIIGIGLWLLVSALFHHKRLHSAPVLAVAAGFVPCPLTTFVMTYAVTKGMTNVGIEGADARARKVLAEYGFSVLTEIDVKATTTSSYEKSRAVLRSAPSTRWRRCRRSRTPN